MQDLLSGLTAPYLAATEAPDHEPTYTNTHADALHRYLSYLFARRARPPAERIRPAGKAFDLHAAQRALTPIGSEVEQRLELIQVSAGIPGPLSTRSAGRPPAS